MEMKKRYRGAMLGMAAGDALGTTVEFRARGTFQPMTEIVGGGAFNLRPGQWTDDTAMGLCMAESLSKRKSFDPDHQMDLYVEWWQRGHNSSVPGVCVDIGSATRAALRLWKSRRATADPNWMDPYCGDPGHDTAGNGCIMRMAPIVLFAHGRPIAERAELYRLSSKTTHAAPQCLDGTEAMGLLLELILSGVEKERLPQAWIEVTNEAKAGRDYHPHIQEIVNGSYLVKPEREIIGGGYVAHCLEAAMWSFWRTDSFVEAARTAVNLGNDADTTGAVVGQIAGAFYGEDAIPDRWRKILARRDRLEKYADKLLEVSRGKK